MIPALGVIVDNFQKPRATMDRIFDSFIGSLISKSLINMGNFKYKFGFIKKKRVYI